MFRHLAAELFSMNHARHRPRLFRIERREQVQVVLEEHEVVVPKHHEPLRGGVVLQHQAEPDERLSQRAEVIIIDDSRICFAWRTPA